jgi:patatin-related protein
VVCYGGVSLAIYMHGQTKEINRLVKASSLLAEGHDPAGASPSERVYAELLEASAEDGVRTRVVVDVVAGTSAGGINGVCLAKAVAGNRSQDGLRRLWLERGDIGGLVRGWRRLPWKLRLAIALPRLVRRPPLHGEMASWVYRALEEMDGAAPEPAQLETLMPLDHELELFVTVTDYYGYPRQIVLAESDPDEREDPVAIYDWRHRHALRFARADGIDQFRPEHNPALALAARATSSFPGAFPPVSFASFADALRAAGTDVDLTDPDLERGYFRLYGLSRRVAAGTFFIDGGVLDNRPFGHAISAIRRRPASAEVDRKLVYLEPDPAGNPAPQEQLDEPMTVPTVLGAISGIPRKEPILDDLLEIARRNEDVRRVRDVIEASFSSIAERVEALVGDALCDLPADAADERLAKWGAEINTAARGDAGFSYATYIRMKIGDVVDSYAGTVCRVNEYPDDCNQAFFVRSALRAWARRRGLFEQEGAPTEEQIDFLRRFDLRYGDRRIRLVIAGVNWFYRDVGNPGFPSRSELDVLKRRLYDAVEVLRSARMGEGAEETLARRVTDVFGEDALWRFADGEGFKPIAFATAHESELDAMRDGFAAYLDGRLEGFTAALYGDVHRLTAAWDPNRRADLFVRYLGFPFWDVLLYPVQSLSGVGERDHIEVARMSPGESTLLSRAVPRELAGLGVHHFGAFFTRPGRETDYLWGRLDAAERLVEMLLGRDDPAFEESCRKAFAAVIEEEREALPAAGELIARLESAISRLREQ